MSININEIENLIKPTVMGWINSAIASANFSGLTFDMPDNVAYLDVAQTFSEKQVVTDLTTDDTDASLAALYANIIASPASDDAGIKIGTWSSAYSDAGNANDVGPLWGIAGYAFHYGSGVASSVSGIVGSSYNYSSTTIPLAYGGQFGVNNSGAGDIGSALAIFVGSPGNSGGGTIDYANGLTIQNQGLAGMTTAKGIHIDAQTGATANYAIVSDGGDVILRSNVDKGEVEYITNTGGNEELRITAYDNTPVLRQRRSGGTEASPSQTASGTALGGIFWSAYQDSGGWTSSSIANIRAQTEENITSSAWGAKILMSTGDIGAGTLATRLSIDGYGRIALNTTATLDSTARKVLALGAGTAPGGGTSGVAYLYAKTVAGLTSLWSVKSDGTEFEIGEGGGSGAGTAGFHEFQARLSFTSGTYATTSDVTGATSVYLVASDEGNNVGLYDGASEWSILEANNQSLSLSGLIKGVVYDVFVYDDSGTLTLEALAWKKVAASNNPTAGSSKVINLSDTTDLAVGMEVSVKDGSNSEIAVITAVSAGTSITVGTLANSYTTPDVYGYPARATALTTQNGVLVKSGATTRRYAGSLRITGTTGESEDSTSRRALYNHYNRVPRPIKATMPTSNWSPGTSVTRRALNSNVTAGQSRVYVLVGYAPVYAEARGNYLLSANSDARNNIGFGFNSVTTLVSSSLAHLATVGATGGSWYYLSPQLSGYVTQLGSTYIQALENTGSGGGMTVIGDSGGPTSTPAEFRGYIEA